MNTKTPIIMLALVSAAAFAPLAAAQQKTGGPAWHGQDSEFGSIRAPYSADMNGERASIEAKVVLRKNYEEKDSRFFMFAFTVENTPLDVSFDSLIRTDTGEELPCYQRQGDEKSQIKCFVDLKDMPPAGTEIIMSGTVGAGRAGNFQVGALVVPFTYTWARVPMSNGLDAELYGYTMVNVYEPTGKDGIGAKFSGPGNAIPGLGALGVAAAALLAVGLVALRRRS